MIFTSGTTGLPKASITTHLKIFRVGAQLGVNVMTLSPKDTYYCALPLYHSNALVVGFGSCVYSGATFALRRKRHSHRGGLHRSANRRHQSRQERCAIRWRPEREAATPPTRSVALGNGLRPDIWMEFKNRFGINRIHEFYGASKAIAASSTFSISTRRSAGRRRRARRGTSCLMMSMRMCRCAAMTSSCRKSASATPVC